MFGAKARRIRALEIRIASLVEQQDVALTRRALTEGELAEMIRTGQAATNDFAYCPAEERTTFHALHPDGSRRCWTCSTTTAGGR